MVKRSAKVAPGMTGPHARAQREYGPKHEVTSPARLDGFLRVALDLSWGRARGFIEGGKVFVDGTRVLDTSAMLRAGSVVTVNERAPRPSADVPDDLIVYVDAHVVVVRKPPFVSTVPYEPGERGTLDELTARALPHARGHGPRPTLGVVHRLDKETSGLVVFTRSWLAKKSLSSQFRAHSVVRRYLAIAHGDVSRRTITSHFVADRGDGLRGSTEHMRGPHAQGQKAVTHIEPLERLEGATLVQCRLDTGRTHQIRIHLAELGHPVLGERVYVRDFREPPIPASRMMLHATELGFVHPKTNRLVQWEEAPPEDFQATLARLKH
jgi:23S rRNA pseudouridine1911/1915/1917 synthase